MAENLVIVGSGPAGLTAGIYAARAGFSPLVLEGMLSGGQLTQTTEIENYPGFANPIGGLELMAAMRSQAERCGVRFAMDEVERVDFSGDGERRLFGMAGEYSAKAVVVATGASARWTGLPGEAKYRSRGVSACATCDGAFFRGREVAVIGGGDTALSDALHLASLAAKVTVIHRRDAFRGAKALADRVLAAPNVDVAWNTTVVSFDGDGARLSGLTLSDGRSLPVSGAFVAIGNVPQTKFLDGSGVELDGAGYVVAHHTRTSVRGVFAAGDCADPRYRQAVVAAGAGAAAAMEAQRFLQEGGSQW